MKANFPHQMDVWRGLRGILLGALLLGTMGVQAQIGIGTTTPHPSSMLHIQPGNGNNRGVILPSLSSSNRVVLDSTQNIQHGTIVFDRDLQKHYFFGQSPRTWRELEGDWIRKDVAGAAPIIGTHIYLGTSGNVGIGTTVTDNPNAKLTVNGDMIVGNAAYVTTTTAPTTSSMVVQTWMGISFATKRAIVPQEALYVKDDVRITDDLTVTDDVTADRFFGEGMAPVGSIRMWSDVYVTSGNGFDSNGEGIGYMEGWALCDGRGGRPDLRGRFIVGLTDNRPNGPDYNNTERNHPDYLNIGDYGGKDSVQLTTSELPSHSHTGTALAPGSEHNHTYQHMNDYEGYDLNFNGDPEVFKWNNMGNRTTSTDGAHSHDLDIDDAGEDKKHENRPPYFTLVYIIKLP
jgi:microcystin-dependent protein